MVPGMTRKDESERRWQRDPAAEPSDSTSMRRVGWSARSAAAAAAMICGLVGCGSSAHVGAGKVPRDENFSNAGQWLGTSRSGEADRDCGYLVYRRFAVLEVRVTKIVCGRAAEAIRETLQHGLRIPEGLTGEFQRGPKAPPGAPPSLRAFRGRLTLGTDAGATITGIVAEYRGPAEPNDVGEAPPRFGCSTKSSLCG